MRSFVAALALLCFALPVAAQQSGTVSFDAPNTGGAPTGYRIYRDNVLVGAVTPGQSVTALAPSNAGTWVLGVEAFNATGPGTRVNKSVTIGALPPGPVRNLTFTFSCSTSTPPACGPITITDAP